MARHKVHHDTDATTIVIKGQKSSPEPSTAIIIFPGGALEVSRTSDGDYWAHIAVNPNEGIQGASVRTEKRGDVVDSRVDYKLPRREIVPVPNESEIQHIAIRITTS